MRRRCKHCGVEIQANRYTPIEWHDLERGKSYVHCGGERRPDAPGTRHEPADDPQHFDHAEHMRRLEAAENELRSLGRHDLAGAVSRAAVLHRDMQSRVAHAAHAMRQLDLAQETARGSGVDPGGVTVGGRIRRARELLDRYTAKREAPWLTPSPVLFPDLEDLIEGR